MTTLIVSTVYRHQPHSKSSGFIYTVDLESRQIIRRSQILEPPYQHLDDNPRGGMRGSKGISVRDDQITLSNYSMLFRYDPQWNLLGLITHPSCANIHDIGYFDDSLWVCASQTDMLLRFDLSGNLTEYRYLRDQSPAINDLGWSPPVLLTPEEIYDGEIDFRDPTTHKKEEYDMSHVNSFCHTRNGDMLVSLGFVFGMDYAKLLDLKKWLVKKGVWPILMALNHRARTLLRVERQNVDNTLLARPAKARSAVVRIAKDGTCSLCLALPGVTAPCHSLLRLPDDTVIILNTTTGSVIQFEPQTGEILSSRRVTDGFLRGATLLNENTILLGSLGKLIIFDWQAGHIAASMQLSDDPKEAIYDIKVLPPHYSLPPSSFAEHFSESTGYQDAAEFVQSGELIH